MHAGRRWFGDHASTAGHDVLQPDERGEPDAELADGAGPGPVASPLGPRSPWRGMPWAKTPPMPAARANSCVLVDGIEVAGGAGVAGELDLLDRAA